MRATTSPSDAVSTTAYVGIGSNLGDARRQVEQALLALDGIAHTRLTGRSSLFRTAPIDAGGDDYVNAVAQLATDLPPDRLLAELQAVEQAFGRERPYPNAPRTLDLDILLYGAQTMSTPALTLPHPRLTARAFALIPLLEIAPFIVIPGKGPAHGFAPGVADQAIARL